MTRRSVLLLVLGLVVAGCDESVDIGHPPPVLVQTDRRVVYVRGAGRDRLERAIDSIAYGERSAVHAVIVSRSAADAEATRRLLIRLGLDPVRIVRSQRRASASEVVLTSATALTAPCAAAVEPTTFGDVGQSLRSLGDCQQTNNLAQMVVDPADLVAPPALGPGDGTYLADGVRTWRQRETSAAKQQASSSTSTAPTSGSPSAAPTTTQMP